VERRETSDCHERMSWQHIYELETEREEASQRRFISAVNHWVVWTCRHGPLGLVRAIGTASPVAAAAAIGWRNTAKPIGKVTRK
jgi:hypothetical protein